MVLLLPCKQCCVAQCSFRLAPLMLCIALVIMHTLARTCTVLYSCSCRSATMACVLCHKPSFAGQRSVLHPESFNNKEQRGFFAKFVSPGYKWPEGLYRSLYFHLLPLKSKIIVLFGITLPPIIAYISLVQQWRIQG